MNTSNPEIFRAIKEDFRAQKLSITAVVCTVFSLLVCMGFSSSPTGGLSLLPESADKRLDLLLALFWIQFAVLALWASKEIVDQTVSDKMDRAWDFIRMTSQSDQSLLSGRIAGPALFPLFVAACFFPATFLIFLATPLANFGQFVGMYVIGANAVLFLWLFSFCAVVRFNSARKPFSYILLIFFVFLVLMGSLNLKMQLFHIYPSYRSYNHVMPVSDPLFYEQQFRIFWWGMFCLLLNNGWLYFLARWNLLLELNSRPKFWSTFALCWGPSTIALCYLNYPASSSQLAPAFYAPFAIFALLLAFVFEEGVEQYKKWLVIGRAKLDETPIWIAGAAALVVGTLVAPAFSHLNMVAFPIATFSFTLIILRDLLIIQIAALYISKHEKLFALAIIVILHGFSDIIIPLLGSSSLTFLFSDFRDINPAVEFFGLSAAKFAISLFQVAAVGLIFVKKLRTTLRL